MLLEAINAPKIIEKLRQAKLLQVEINKTELLLNQAKTALTALGIKSSNLTKLVAQIKASTTPLENTFFKNTAGVLSIVPSVVSAMLDTSVREILAPLIPRDITSAGFEVAKKASVVAIGKDVVKYGMKKADYDAIVKRITETAVQLRYYAYSTEGYLLKFGEVENPYSDEVNNSKIILRFEVVGENGIPLVGDSSLFSDVEGVQVTTELTPTVIDIDERTVARFISNGIDSINQEWFGGETITLTADSRLVNADEYMSINFDVKIKQSSVDGSEIASNWPYYFTLPIINVESSFVLFYYQEYSYIYGEAAKKALCVGTSALNCIRTEGLLLDTWYNVKVDMWHENGVYRKRLIVTNTETQQELDAINVNSPLTQEISGTWLKVGSGPNYYTYGFETYIDNFLISTSPNFIKPAITKFFDPTNTSPTNVLLSNSNRTLKMANNSLTWMNTVSEEVVLSGKKYFEITNIVDNASSLIVGIIPQDQNNLVADFYPGKFEGSFGLAANRTIGLVAYKGLGNVGDYIEEPTVDHITQGGTVKVAIDFDAGTIWFGLNNEWCYFEAGRDTSIFGGPASNAPFSFTPNTPMRICVAIKGSTQEIRLNVGQEPFTYTPPDRYVGWGDIGVI